MVLYIGKGCFYYLPTNNSLVSCFVGLAYYYYQGKDIEFRFNIEYSSLRDFGP